MECFALEQRLADWSRVEPDELMFDYGVASYVQAIMAHVSSVFFVPSFVFNLGGACLCACVVDFFQEVDMMMNANHLVIEEYERIDL
jgi:hypothetical protein